MAIKDEKIFEIFTLKKLKSKSYCFWVPTTFTTLEVYNCFEIRLGNKLKSSFLNVDVASIVTLHKAITS